MLFRYCCLAFVCLTIAACIPPGEEEYEGVLIDLNDPISKRIYDLQNARSGDSLVVYLRHGNPSYRYLAARALSSFPSLEEGQLDSLVTLLADPEQLVRSAAAYAIGQSGREAYAEDLVGAFDGSGNYADFNAAVLAAVGKIGAEEDLANLAGVTTYTAEDTLLRAGQAWGLYYFGRRGMNEPAGTDHLVELFTAQETPTEVRLPATYYLQRFAVELDEDQLGKIRTVLRSDADPNARMAAAKVTGRAGGGESRVALLRRLREEPDWRVRVEIIRALENFDYSSVREPLLAALKDQHPLVARTAAGFFLAKGAPTDATLYRRMSQDSLATPIRHELLRAANRHLPVYLTDYREAISYDLRQAFAKTTAPYDRAQLLTALGEYPWNYRIVHNYFRQSDNAVVRAAAAEALAGISNREDFNTFFRGSAARVRSDLAGYFQSMIAEREVAPAYYAAGALAENPEVYRPFYFDQSWLRSTLAAFELPKEIETYRAVDAARAALNGEEPPAPRVVESGAKSINWDLIGSSGNREVMIRTAEGRVVLELFPDVAPATVSSFLELIASRYYDGKTFHRVVPNFVAQGGGPAGNGFGSENFSVRTETPGLRWDRPGLVGMASAGKDTEGVQFFITHQPTPHLDGNYTIFGAVTEGQEVVDLLEPGSKIESIQLR